MAETVSFVAGIATAIRVAVGLGTFGMPVPSSVTPPPVPENAQFPVLTVQQITGEEGEVMEGLNGLTATVIQVNAWSPNYDEAFALRKNVLGVLFALTGAVAGTPLVVDRTTGFTYRELYDGSRELHQLILRCTVWWTA